ncbi:hypothetical protein HYPGJ_20232 [Hyphomicrobium sp. GJ21]|nr:hypothetical protein HYPGJ_20232 [Hyphomicrobium sp. GJ21]
MVFRRRCTRVHSDADVAAINCHKRFTSQLAYNISDWAKVEDNHCASSSDALDLNQGC